jgi:hypothetical protein
MRRTSAILPALAFAAFAAIAPAYAADDKTLQNMHGDVSYLHAKGTPQSIAPNARTALSDADYAITGIDSLAAVGLPDSSRVLVGASSKVQLGAFTQLQGTTAKFFVYNGKVRFIVQHPQGAKADYTFQTTTGTVGVRGTEGDIDVSGNELRVNVYEVCDASEPVTVTTKGGGRFTLVAGQSLVAALVNGVVQAKVEQLTQALIDRFSPDFGVPSSWDAAKGQVIAAAQNQASGALDSATGGYGNQITSAVGGLFKRKSTPAPSPVPTSSSCSH